jgi:hypothetical protein
VDIRNHTPFAAGIVVLLDRSGAEQLHVVLKATFAFTETGQLTVADEQQPIASADTFREDPASSSITQEAELMPLKPATDLFLVGSARAMARNVRHMQIGFRVGANQKTAVVFGSRVWVRHGAGVRATDPEPIEAVPLIYENAFGGADLSAEDPARHEREVRNPVGRGFRARHSTLPWEGELLPSIEDPAAIMSGPQDRAAPVGFGPLGRAWQPRVQYAGTYDQAWIDHRMPLLPNDFDDRFYNAAPPDLIAPGHLVGGEWVDVVGCTAGGRVFFQLPVVAPRFEVQVGGRSEDVTGACDTVTVDTDAMQLRMVWKAQVRVHGEVPVLRRITCRVDGVAG